MFYRWVTKLQFQLLPPTCLLCGAPGEGERDLCPPCYVDLPRNHYACRCCALPLEGPERDLLLCGRCQRRPPAFHRIFAPLLYRPPVDFLVQGLKFQGRLSHARLLGELLANALAEQKKPLPECIIPVPLHPARLRERGFNQALELARPVARRLRVPVRAFCARRIRRTPPQSSLDLRTRRHNVRDAFRLRQPIAARHVAIIDDVVTSTSTVAEFSRMLRAAGVAVVEVWACARTPP